MNIDSIYPSKYLKSGDVTETPRSYTIVRSEIEQVGRDKEERLVLYFDNQEKGFVVNKTNLNTIAKVLGTKETEEWKGQAIKLYKTEVQYGDEMVEAIRVSLRPGQAKLSRPDAPVGPVTVGSKPQWTKEELKRVPNVEADDAGTAADWSEPEHEKEPF